MPSKERKSLPFRVKSIREIRHESDIATVKRLYQGEGGSSSVHQQKRSASSLSGGSGATSQAPSFGPPLLVPRKLLEEQHRRQEEEELQRQLQQHDSEDFARAARSGPMTPEPRRSASGLVVGAGKAATRRTPGGGQKQFARTSFLNADVVYEADDPNAIHVNDTAERQRAEEEEEEHDRRQETYRQQEQQQQQQRRQEKPSEQTAASVTNITQQQEQQPREEAEDDKGTKSGSLPPIDRAQRTNNILDTYTVEEENGNELTNNEHTKNAHEDRHHHREHNQTSASDDRRHHALFAATPSMIFGSVSDYFEPEEDEYSQTQTKKNTGDDTGGGDNDDDDTDNDNSAIIAHDEEKTKRRRVSPLQIPHAMKLPIAQSSLKLEVIHVGISHRALEAKDLVAFHGMCRSVVKPSVIHFAPNVTFEDPMIAVNVLRELVHSNPNICALINGDLLFPAPAPPSSSSSPSALSSSTSSSKVGHHHHHLIESIMDRCDANRAAIEKAHQTKLRKRQKAMLEKAKKELLRAIDVILKNEERKRFTLESDERRERALIRIESGHDRVRAAIACERRETKLAFDRAILQVQIDEEGARERFIRNALFDVRRMFTDREIFFRVQYEYWFRSELKQLKRGEKDAKKMLDVIASQQRVKDEFKRKVFMRLEKLFRHLKEAALNRRMLNLQTDCLIAREHVKEVVRNRVASEMRRAKIAIDKKEEDRQRQLAEDQKKHMARIAFEDQCFREQENEFNLFQAHVDRMTAVRSEVVAVAKQTRKLIEPYLKKLAKRNDVLLKFTKLVSATPTVRIDKLLDTDESREAQYASNGAAFATTAPQGVPGQQSLFLGSDIAIFPFVGTTVSVTLPNGFCAHYENFRRELPKFDSELQDSFLDTQLKLDEFEKMLMTAYDKILVLQRPPGTARANPVLAVDEDMKKFLLSLRGYVFTKLAQQPRVVAHLPPADAVLRAKLVPLESTECEATAYLRESVSDVANVSTQRFFRRSRTVDEESAVFLPAECTRAHKNQLPPTEFSFEEVVEKLQTFSFPAKTVFRHDVTPFFGDPHLEDVFFGCFGNGVSSTVAVSADAATRAAAGFIPTDSVSTGFTQKRAWMCNSAYLALPLPKFSPVIFSTWLQRLGFGSMKLYQKPADFAQVSAGPPLRVVVATISLLCKFLSFKPKLVDLFAESEALFLTEGPYGISHSLAKQLTSAVDIIVEPTTGSSDSQSTTGGATTATTTTNTNSTSSPTGSSTTPQQRSRGKSVAANKQQQQQQQQQKENPSFPISKADNHTEPSSKKSASSAAAGEEKQQAVVTSHALVPSKIFGAFDTFVGETWAGSGAEVAVRPPIVWLHASQRMLRIELSEYEPSMFGEHMFDAATPLIPFACTQLFPSKSSFISVPKARVQDAFRFQITASDAAAAALSSADVPSSFSSSSSPNHSHHPPPPSTVALRCGLVMMGLPSANLGFNSEGSTRREITMSGLHVAYIESSSTDILSAKPYSKFAAAGSSSSSSSSHQQQHHLNTSQSSSSSTSGASAAAVPPPQAVSRNIDRSFFKDMQCEDDLTLCVYQRGSSSFSSAANSSDDDEEEEQQQKAGGHHRDELQHHGASSFSRNHHRRRCSSAPLVDIVFHPDKALLDRLSFSSIVQSVVSRLVVWCENPRLTHLLHEKSNCNAASSAVPSSTPTTKANSSAQPQPQQQASSTISTTAVAAQHDFAVIPPVCFNVDVRGSIGSGKSELAQSTWLGVCAFRRSPKPILSFSSAKLLLDQRVAALRASVAGEPIPDATQMLRTSPETLVVMRVPSANAEFVDHSNAPSSSLVIAIFDDVSISRSSDAFRTFPPDTQAQAPPALRASATSSNNTTGRGAIAATSPTTGSSPQQQRRSSTHPSSPSQQPQRRASSVVTLTTVEEEAQQQENGGGPELEEVMRHWASHHPIYGGLIRISILDATTPHHQQHSTQKTGSGPSSSVSSATAATKSSSQQQKQQQVPIDSSTTQVVLQPYEKFEIVQQFAKHSVVSGRTGELSTWEAPFEIETEEYFNSTQHEDRFWQPETPFTSPTFDSSDNSNSNSSSSAAPTPTSRNNNINKSKNVSSQQHHQHHPKTFVAVSDETGEPVAKYTVESHHVTIQLLLTSNNAEGKVETPVDPLFVASLIQSVCFRTSRAPKWTPRRFAVTMKLAWCSSDPMCFERGNAIAGNVVIPSPTTQQQQQQTMVVSQHILWSPTITHTVCLTFAASPFVVEGNAVLDKRPISSASLNSTRAFAAPNASTGSRPSSSSVMKRRPNSGGPAPPPSSLARPPSPSASTMRQQLPSRISEALRQRARSNKLWIQAPVDVDPTAETLRISDCGILFSAGILAATSKTKLPVLTPVSHLAAQAQPQPSPSPQGSATDAAAAAAGSSLFVAQQQHNTGIVFAKGNAIVIEYDAKAGACFPSDTFQIKGKDPSLSKFGTKFNASMFTDMTIFDDTFTAINMLFEKVRARFEFAVLASHRQQQSQWPTATVASSPPEIGGGGRPTSATSSVGGNGDNNESSSPTTTYGGQFCSPKFVSSMASIVTAGFKSYRSIPQSECTLKELSLQGQPTALVMVYKQVAMFFFVRDCCLSKKDIDTISKITSIKCPPPELVPSLTHTARPTSSKKILHTTVLDTTVLPRSWETEVDVVYCLNSASATTDIAASPTAAELEAMKKQDQQHGGSGGGGGSSSPSKPSSPTASVMMSASPTSAALFDGSSSASASGAGGGPSVVPLLQLRGSLRQIEGSSGAAPLAAGARGPTMEDLIAPTKLLRGGRGVHIASMVGAADNTRRRFVRAVDPASSMYMLKFGCEPILHWSDWDANAVLKHHAFPDTILNPQAAATWKWPFSGLRVVIDATSAVGNIISVQQQQQQQQAAGGAAASSSPQQDGKQGGGKSGGGGKGADQQQQQQQQQQHQQHNPYAAPPNHNYGSMPSSVQQQMLMMADDGDAAAAATEYGTLGILDPEEQAELCRDTAFAMRELEKQLPRQRALDISNNHGVVKLCRHWASHGFHVKITAGLEVMFHDGIVLAKIVSHSDSHVELEFCEAAFVPKLDYAALSERVLFLLGVWCWRPKVLERGLISQAALLLQQQQQQQATASSPLERTLQLGDAGMSPESKPLSLKEKSQQQQHAAANNPSGGAHMTKKELAAAAAAAAAEALRQTEGGVSINFSCFYPSNRDVTFGRFLLQLVPATPDTRVLRNATATNPCLLPPAVPLRRQSCFAGADIPIPAPPPSAGAAGAGPHNSNTNPKVAFLSQLAVEASLIAQLSVNPEANLVVRFQYAWVDCAVFKATVPLSSGGGFMTTSSSAVAGSGFAGLPARGANPASSPGSPQTHNIGGAATAAGSGSGSAASLEDPNEYFLVPLTVKPLHAERDKITHPLPPIKLVSGNGVTVREDDAGRILVGGKPTATLFSCAAGNNGSVTMNLETSVRIYPSTGHKVPQNRAKLLQEIFKNVHVVLLPPHATPSPQHHSSHEAAAVVPRVPPSLQCSVFMEQSLAHVTDPTPGGTRPSMSGKTHHRERRASLSSSDDSFEDSSSSSSSSSWCSEQEALPSSQPPASASSGPTISALEVFETALKENPRRREKPAPKLPSNLDLLMEASKEAAAAEKLLLQQHHAQKGGRPSSTGSRRATSASAFRRQSSFAASGVLSPTRTSSSASLASSPTNRGGGGGGGGGSDQKGSGTTGGGSLTTVQMLKTCFEANQVNPNHYLPFEPETQPLRLVGRLDPFDQDNDPAVQRRHRVLCIVTSILGASDPVMVMSRFV